MSLASNRYLKQESGFEKEVSFFNVETWARLAEACYSKGRKGRGVRIVGRLKQERWNDPDGKPRSKVTIIAEHVEFRPEFKKEVKPSSEVPYDGEYPIEELEEETVMSAVGKEMPAMVF